MFRLFNRRQQIMTPGSAAIKALDYDPRKLSLQVTFSNGDRYEYGCVERETYQQLTEAESAGKFFQAHIRGLYPYCQRK
jgi:hypothetical protein